MTNAVTLHCSKCGDFECAVVPDPRPGWPSVPRMGCSDPECGLKGDPSVEVFQMTMHRQVETMYVYPHSDGCGFVCESRQDAPAEPEG